MSDPILVEIPGVGEVEFPATMSAAAVTAAAKRLHDDAAGAATGAAGRDLAVAGAGVAGGSALAGAAVTAAQRLAPTAQTVLRTAERYSQKIPGLHRLGLGAGANLAAQAYDVATGRQSVGSAAVDAATNEALRRAPSAALRLAPSAGPAVAGAGLGLAVPLAALGAIQHDANRRPDIDPDRATPASAILRGFQTMAGTRKAR